MPGDHLPPQFNRSPGPSLFSLEGRSFAPFAGVSPRLPGACSPSAARAAHLNASRSPSCSIVPAGEPPHLVGSPSGHVPRRRGPQGRRRPAPAAMLTAAWSSSNPLREVAGQTRNMTVRRTGPEARTTPLARQVLVWVPKPNTKYGGKYGKTSRHAGDVMPLTIGESWRIRNRKNLPKRPSTGLRPAVHRGSIYSPANGLFGLHRRDSRAPTGYQRGRHVPQSLVWPGHCRQAADPTDAPVIP